MYEFIVGGWHCLGVWGLLTYQSSERMCCTSVSRTPRYTEHRACRAEADAISLPLAMPTSSRSSTVSFAHGSAVARSPLGPGVRRCPGTTANWLPREPWVASPVPANPGRAWFWSPGRSSSQLDESLLGAWSADAAAMESVAWQACCCDRRSKARSRVSCMGSFRRGGEAASAASAWGSTLQAGATSAETCMATSAAWEEAQPCADGFERRS